MEPRGQFTKPAGAAGVAAASTLPRSWVKLLGKTITSALVHDLLRDGAQSMSICLTGGCRLNGDGKFAKYPRML